MKKLKLLSIMGILILLCTNIVFASNNFEILKFEMPDDKKEGVRLSEIFEGMEAKINTSNSSNTYKVVKGDVEITFNNNSKTATVNGVRHTMEFPARVYSNIAYIPYSFAEQNAALFGYKIRWDSAIKKVLGSKIVKSISFSQSNVSVKEGDKASIELTAVYTDGTKGDIVSKSKYGIIDSSVATVVKDGPKLMISARNVGAAKLTATYEGLTTEVAINVVRDANLYGNWIGNISNKSRIVTGDNSVYYANPHDGYRLYITDKELLKRKKINDDKPNYMSYIDGWLYYSNQADSHKIYKVKADGSERTKITEDGAYYLNIVDGWIYYQNVSDSNKIYKVRIDGKEKQKLSDDSSTGLNVCYGWIFYTNNSDGKKIYKVMTDGTGRKKVNFFAAQNLSVYDKWIYYSNMAESGSLYKISIEGKDGKKLTKSPVSSVNVYSGWVYYANESDNNKLYRVKIDGTENMKICDESVTNINILDDWIYINSFTSNKSKLLRFKIGSISADPIEPEEFLK